MPVSLDPRAYFEDPDDEFLYLRDWRELVGGEAAPSCSGAVSRTSQTGQLVGVVPFWRFRSASLYFLGNTECDAGPPYRLHRTPPAFFPLMPQMRCFAVGFQPRYLLANPAGTVAVETPVGTFPELARVPNFDTPWWDYYGNPVRTGLYREMVLTLSYQSFDRVNFQGDAGVASFRDEWDRWTQWDFAPDVQALSADNASQYLFAEGEPQTAGPARPPAYPTGSPVAFPVPVAQLLAKSAVTAKVWSLPHAYVSTHPVRLYPQKVIERLGTVNDRPFLEYPRGTLLLTGAKFEPTLFAVAPSQPEAPLSGWDVSFFWEHVDPPKGVPDSAARGHLVLPWRKTGLYYLAVREDGSTVFPPTEHAKLLQHVQDNS